MSPQRYETHAFSQSELGNARRKVSALEMEVSVMQRAKDIAEEKAFTESTQTGKLSADLDASKRYGSSLLLQVRELEKCAEDFKAQVRTEYDRHTVGALF